MSGQNKLIAIALKLAITCVLLYLIFSGVDLQRVGSAALAVRPEAVVFAVALHMLVFVLGALRWWLLAQHAGLGLPFMKVFPSYYLGVFFNNFLPTGVGGDLVRILHLKRRHVDLGTLVSSTVIDRVIGLGVVLATGLIALALSSQVRLDDRARLLLFVTAAIAVSSVLILGSDWFGALIRGLTKRFQRTRIRKTLLETIESLHNLRDRKTLVLSAILISLSVQCLIVLSYYILSQSMGLGQPMQIFFIAVPVIFLAAALPISLGGLGVREGTLVMLLVTAGSDKAEAASLSLVYLAVMWMASLPGAFTLLASQPKNVRSDAA
jgi:glycosyltransferase 2 family protein